MTRVLIPVFLLLSLLNLYAEQQDHETLIFISKPLLLTTLSLWFYLQVRPLRIKTARFILAGLLFSIGGDTLLMFVENGPKDEKFFLLGLGSFLLAQVCYLLGFIYYPGSKTGSVAQKPAWAIPFVVYLIGIMSLLWPNIPGPMRLPVGVYSLAIVGMATAAFNLRPLLLPKVFWGLMAGVLLFVLSDSLIALNRFMGDAISIPFPRVSIMLTYLLGQYLIASRATFFVRTN